MLILELKFAVNNQLILSLGEKMNNRNQILLILLFFLLGKIAMNGQANDYVTQVAESIVFIYSADKQPCNPSINKDELIPSGSGFVLGVPKKGIKPERWEGWKFLITCEHVIHNQDKITLRLNRNDVGEYTCFTIDLIRSGSSQNLFSLSKEVDLVAISIPDIPNTDPLVFDNTMILDNQKMKELEVEIGTEVFSVGYLFGYSGMKKNYPVTKFGKISLLSEEIWYKSPNPRNIIEKAYLIELQNVPGLSGSPVLLKGPQFKITKDKQFQFRNIPPLILGVIKGALLSPIGGTQGIAAIEPSINLNELVKKISKILKDAGYDVDDQ